MPWVFFPGWTKALPFLLVPRAIPIEVVIIIQSQTTQVGFFLQMFLVLFLLHSEFSEGNLIESLIGDPFIPLRECYDTAIYSFTWHLPLDSSE